MSDRVVGDWPVALRGVTESVVTTPGPDGRWNAAALGLHAGDPVTARTWGRTRTRRNFEREGRGVVQFVDDPVLFAEAALGVVERDGSILDAAAAWVAVDVERVETGTDGGTERVTWRLDPADGEVVRESVPTINRGFNAVVGATVAASRLGVPTYDEATLRDRLDFLASVVDACGGDSERQAMARVEALADLDFDHGFEHNG